MAQETTVPNVIRLESGDSLDDFRQALAALGFAWLEPADEQSVAVVREVIELLQSRLAEHGKAETLPERTAPEVPKLANHVFRRAQEAGSYRPLREEVLSHGSPDPQIASLR